MVILGRKFAFIFLQHNHPEGESVKVKAHVEGCNKEHKTLVEATFVGIHKSIPGAKT